MKGLNVTRKLPCTRMAMFTVLMSLWPGGWAEHSSEYWVWMSVLDDDVNMVSMMWLWLLLCGLVTMRLWVAAVLLPDWLPDTGHWWSGDHHMMEAGPGPGHRCTPGHCHGTRHGALHTRDPTWSDPAGARRMCKEVVKWFRGCATVASVLAGGLSTAPITAKALSLCTFDGESPHLQCNVLCRRGASSSSVRLLFQD